MNNNFKMETVNNIYGSWISKEERLGEGIPFPWKLIIIDKDMVEIVEEEKENGPRIPHITFSSHAHWSDNYLVFTEERRFFILYANKKELQFGEFKTPEIYGEFNWIKTFTREK